MHDRRRVEEFNLIHTRVVVQNVGALSIRPLRDLALHFFSRLYMQWSELSEDLGLALDDIHVHCGAESVDITGSSEHHVLRLRSVLCVLRVSVHHFQVIQRRTSRLIALIAFVDNRVLTSLHFLLG